MRFRLVPAIVMAVSLTAAACTSSSAETSTTTTTTEVPTQTVTTEAATETVAAEAATETTTVSPEDNLATAEAVVAAMFEPGEEAFDGFPWFDPFTKADVVSAAFFGEALHVKVLGVSCDLVDPQLVQCQFQGSDDLSDALGSGSVSETYEFSFKDSGEISGFVSEAQDGGVGETFTNWAWNIAYPGICESPAQCALALLDVVDEYNETYPGATVASYMAAYNSGDIDAVMALFTEESSVSGHPLGRIADGLSAIRSIQSRDIDFAADANAYSISNVQVTGDTVTWDHAWVDDVGETYCVEGQTAVVTDGTILKWTWPVGQVTCP